MLSGRLTFELSVVLTSKEILCFTQKVLVKELILLTAQREVSIRLVDVVEKLVSFICSVYLFFVKIDFFFFLSWGGQISLIFQYVGFNTHKIIFPMQNWI